VLVYEEFAIEYAGSLLLVDDVNMTPCQIVAQRAAAAAHAVLNYPTATGPVAVSRKSFDFISEMNCTFLLQTWQTSAQHPIASILV
jgi:hypothetical protein